MLETTNPILDEEGAEIFKIGHDMITQTIMPEIYEKNGLNICDLPELSDRLEKNIKIINYLITKKLIKAAKNIRIVLVLSADSFLSDRGRMVKETITTLNSIFKNRDFSSHINSIFPIVTRYNKHNSYILCCFY